MGKMTVYCFDLVSGLRTVKEEIDLLPNGGYMLSPGQTEEPWPEEPPGMCAVRGQIGWELVPAEDLRRAAYTAEADVFRDQAVSYQQEAEAWRNAGNEDRAASATDKAKEALRQYLEKKEEIRARFPEASAAPMSAPMEADAEEKFALMPTGTYHRQSCSYVTDTAELATLAEIDSGIPDAKPCGHCKPPTMEANA